MILGMATIVGRLGANHPLLLAGLLMESIPPMPAFVLLQRYIYRGLVIGAMKQEFKHGKPRRQRVTQDGIRRCSAGW